MTSVIGIFVGHVAAQTIKQSALNDAKALVTKKVNDDNIDYTVPHVTSSQLTREIPQGTTLQDIYLDPNQITINLDKDNQDEKKQRNEKDDKLDVLARRISNELYELLVREGGQRVGGSSNNGCGGGGCGGFATTTTSGVAATTSTTPSDDATSSKELFVLQIEISSLSTGKRWSRYLKNGAGFVKLTISYTLSSLDKSKIYKHGKISYVDPLLEKESFKTRCGKHSGEIAIIHILPQISNLIKDEMKPQRLLV